MEGFKFDEKFLRKVIKTGEDYINCKEIIISESRKTKIEKTINVCSNLLSIITNENDCVFSKEQVKVTKKDLLIKMYNDFKTIDPNITEFICDLKYVVKDFYPFSSKYNCDTTPSKIVDNSLLIYEKYAKEFLPFVKNIISYKPCLINFSSKHHVGTQCNYLELLELPFLEIEEYQHNPSQFIHELQHVVEIYKYPNMNNYYTETGAITFETLYIDSMYEQKIHNSEVLYYARLNVINSMIDYLSSYFKVLKRLEECNFCISKDKFVDILHSSGIIFSDGIPEFMFNIDINSYLMYVISFLKSIEVRNAFQDSPFFGMKALKKVISSEEYEKENFLLPLINLENYQKELRVKVLERKTK